jgi:DNA-binding transcriptional LysR family regulator
MINTSYIVEFLDLFVTMFTRRGWMLDAHQINVFLVAAKELNFSEAARRLNMTQPSVSQHIQAMEKRFGLPLFRRSGRHLSLTEAGETLLPMAREFVNHSIHIEETMASVKGDVHGHLVIACCTTAGRFLLPKLLARFRSNYPNVQVTCHVTDQDTGLGLLWGGKLHLAVSSEREIGKDLEFRPFISDTVVLVVHPDHPWSKEGEIKPKDLLQGEFIFREETSGTHKALSNALPEIGLSVDQLQKIMVLGTSHAVAMAVQEGIGVAFITKIAASVPIESGDLIEVQVKGLCMQQEVWIGRNTHHPATQSQTAFWDFVNDPDNEVLKKLRQKSQDHEVVDLREVFQV